MFAIKRPIAIFMFTIALAIFGYRSMQNINLSFLPEIEYPEFIVVCNYPNSTTEEVEKYITRPIEESISSLSGIRDIISYSRDGHSIINLQFHWDIDAQYTLLRIREKIESVTDRFPAEAERPYIMDFNPGSLPIMEFTFSGDCKLTELSNFAEDVIKPRFSQIDGVASAVISGMPEEAIQIISNRKKCNQYKISQSSIETAIRQNLPNKSFSHEVKVGYAKHKLTVEFPIDNLQDMLNIPVKSNRGKTIKLGKIARIKKAPLPFYAHSYNDTIPALSTSIYKEAGANSIEASERAIREIENLTEKYPEFKFRVIKNQGDYVKQALNSLKQSIGLGAILAFLVIFLFLKDLRYSIILSIVIPVSLLLTFNALFLHDITFNIMTLGGLALGIGLIVDNGIVMLDSINKSYNADNKYNSIYQGVKKVRRAIAGSTFTTIAIFFPIIYVRGYAAVLFKEQALAIIYVIIISFIAALTLIPSAFSSFTGDKTKNYNNLQEYPKFKRILIKIIRFIIRLPALLFKYGGILISKALQPLFYGFDYIYKKTEKLYHQVLNKFLDNKKYLFIILAGLIVIAYAGFKFVLTSRYWPDVPSQRVEIQVEIPGEYPYKEIKKETVKTISNFLQMESVENVVTKTHDPFTSSTSIQTIGFTPGYYTLSFTLNLTEPINTANFNRSGYKQVITLPYEQITITHPTPLRKEMSGQKGKNFIVYFKGENEKQIDILIEKLADYLKNDTEAEEIVIDRGGIKKVYFASLDNQLLKKYDYDPLKAAGHLKTITSGNRAGWWQIGSRKIPIMLHSDSIGVKPLYAIMDDINDPSRIPVRNEQIFTTSLSRKILEQKRVNRKPVISMEAHVKTGDLTDVSGQINNWIRKHQVPGVDIFISGESRRITRSFNDLYKAFLLATIIVYLILAAQFESFLHPFNIILTVPIGLMGSILGLMIFGLSLNVISLIGIVMLIGIGVNDAIVKLDYMVYLKQNENKTTREAVLLASRDKFRPVIMTTLTTIVAMLPMALGFGGNAEINQPLAVTIIGGLFFTTVLTLFITPTVFEIMEKEQSSVDGIQS